MRGRGMKRCRAEGAERFALFVGAAVLANNLMIIGELLTKRSRRRRKTNRRVPQLTGDAAKQTAVLIATLSTTAPRAGQPAPKMTREALANSPARQYSYADEIGITDLSPLKIHQFRDRN